MCGEFIMKKILLLSIMLFSFTVAMYPKEVLPLKYWFDKLREMHTQAVADKLNTGGRAESLPDNPGDLTETDRIDRNIAQLEAYMAHLNKKIKLNSSKVKLDGSAAADPVIQEIKQKFYFEEVLPLVYPDRKEAGKLESDLEQKNITFVQAEEILRSGNRDYPQLKELVNDLNLLYKASESMSLICEQIGQMRDSIELKNKPLIAVSDEDALRSQWVSFLGYRKALLVMVNKYRTRDFYKKSPAAHRMVKFLYYGTMITLFKNSLQLVHTTKCSDKVWAKLNEKDISWDIEKEQLQGIYKKLAQYRNRRILTDICNEYSKEFQDERKNSGVKHWLHEKILKDIEYIQQNSLTIWTAKLEILWDNVKGMLDRPRYSILSAIEEWVGDHRYSKGEIGPGMTHELLNDLKSRLQPGDFLVSRKNYYLSNIFLGGFWPHGLLYVGSVDDLKKLGITDHPAVRKHLQEYASPALDGNERLFIESKSEGVTMESAEIAMHADYICAFSPQVSLEKRKKAIIDAFSHVGKNYDYDFDFFSSEELACTEVLYQIYSGDISFPLIKKMGKTVVTGNLLVEHWKNERSKPERDYDFIFFLNQSKSKGLYFGTPEELEKTLDLSGVSSMAEEVMESGLKKSIFW